MVENKKESKISLVTSTIKLLWHYSKKKRSQLIISFVMALIATGFSLFAIFLMGDMMNLLNALVINKGNDDLIKFIVVLSLIFSCYLFQFICSSIHSKLLVNVTQNIGYFLRFDLFNKLQKLSNSYLDTQSTGNLMSVFTNDIDVLVSSFSQAISSIITGTFATIGGLILMFLINPILASISIGISFILFLLVVIFIKKSQPYFVKQQKMLGELSSEIQEYNFAHDMTTLYGYEENVIKEFDDKNKELKKATSKAQLISGLIFPYNNFINNMVITIIIALIMVLFVFSTNLMTISAIKFSSPASIIFMYIMILRQTTSQISQILSQLNALQLTFAASKRVENVLSVPNENNKKRKKVLNVSKAKIEFKDVKFSYVEGKPILKGINFTAEPGSINAIVGPTGSGKTTIINLLSAFYDINDGSILVDGQDISKCKRNSIRDNIALVLQDSFIFSGTIYENIRYGRLDATRKEVIRAAKLSNAHKFISRLPNGYNTIISNEGDLLSEGEKQLISIARIFLSKAKILVLDEATSYVDTKTEKDIQLATRKLMKSKTSIIIAHRLSTIKDADKIVVIKDGEQIEMGNHEQLMKNKQFYYQLNTAMDGDFDIESNK